MSQTVYLVLTTVTVQWFTVEEQLKIITIWQTMFALASFVSALLGYGFYQLNGAAGLRTAGLYNWQWMLLTIALISTIATGRSRMKAITDTQLSSSYSFLTPLSMPNGLPRRTRSSLSSEFEPMTRESNRRCGNPTKHGKSSGTLSRGFSSS